jgi:hypothetical protein
MDQDYFPWRAGRRLTSEVFDHYVARARAERAKAIAEFGRWIARSLRMAPAGLASLGRTSRLVPAIRRLTGWRDPMAGERSQ